MSGTIRNYRQNMSRRQHLILGTSLVAGIAGLLVLVLGISVRKAMPDPTQVPLLSADGRIYYLAVFLSAALTGIAWYVVDPDRAAHYRISYAEVVNEQRAELGTTGWIGPSIATYSAGMFLVMYNRWLSIVVLLLLTTIAIAVYASARYAVVNRIRIQRLRPVASLLIAVLFLAFLGYSAIYLFKAPLRYTVPLVGILTAIMMVLHFAGLHDAWPWSAAWTGVVVLVLAEAVWAMSYWDTSWYIGGAILTLVFFVVGSLAVSRIMNELTALTVYIRLAIAVPAFIVLALLS